jgi:hypothetical protein
MHPTPVKKAIRSLRAGDVITNLACGPCKESMILVLERNGNDTFDFAERGPKLSLIRDKKGPFRWAGDTFVGKEGRPYAGGNHITLDSVVLEGFGMTELGWYKSLAKVGDASHFINSAVLDSLDSAFVAKARAYSDRVKESTQDVINDQQHMIELALGHPVDEHTMKRLIMVMALNGHSAMEATARAMRSNPLDGLLGALMASMFSTGGGPEDPFGDMDDFPGMSSFRFDVRRDGMNGHGRRDERRTAHAPG